MSSRFLLLAIGCLTVIACNTVDKRIGQEDPYLGEAVRYNAAVHTINPDPIYADGAAQPGDSGKKGADAVKRYRSDQVNARHDSQAQRGTTGSDGASGGSGPR